VTFGLGNRCSIQLSYGTKHLIALRDLNMAVSRIWAFATILLPNRFCTAPFV
jgi:hypothetical protein